MNDDDLSTMFEIVDALFSSLRRRPFSARTHLRGGARGNVDFYLSNMGS